jgi:hypothetical protein
MPGHVSLTLTPEHHAELRKHLFPGDGKEAVALALCNRRAGPDRHRLLVSEVTLVPYVLCDRSPTSVRWPTDDVLPSLLERAERGAMTLLKIHSHPSGTMKFSTQDDESDRELLASLGGWLTSTPCLASAVMVPDGHMFGRVFSEKGEPRPLRSIAIPGDDLSFWFDEEILVETANTDLQLRTKQAFGAGTVQAMRGLRVAVVGCSGTGSIVIEQLARLGVGELVLVDADLVEDRNLDRILHATKQDADQRRPKVHVLGDAIKAIDIGTTVERIGSTLGTRAAVEAVAACDAVFGCVDGYEGRELLGRLAAFYLLPYFDVGVRLDADGAGGVDQVCGTIHYVRPGGSTLRDRGVFSREDVEADALRRTDPVEYQRRRKEGYIKGIPVDRPAVISVNMFFASLAVNEFLARLHPYRTEHNRDSALFCVSLSGLFMIREPDSWQSSTARLLARGDVEPRLDLPSLSE